MARDPCGPVVVSAEPVDAGEFGGWLSATLAALRGDGGTEVPCGECRGCCVSSYYIPLRSTDTAALQRIPPQYVVAAASDPDRLFIAYLDNGLCPMLKDGNCSIYHHRPQTCRDYDCRIFAAAGIAAGSDAKQVINNRVQAWRFTYATEAAQDSQRAIQRAAAFIVEHAAAHPESRFPTAPTGVAVLALKCYGVFLDVGTVAKQSREALAAAVLAASRAFDQAIESGNA